MNNRLRLHEELASILGTRNVYFQPPETTKINYPAIIYSRASIDNVFADNDVYNQKDKYSIVVVDKNPDSEIVRKVSKMKTARWERYYTINNLNHSRFVIYYQKYKEK